MDGFAQVVSSEGYPERDGALRWRSTPPGRGSVSERVLEHQPRRLHRIAFTDPAMEGELEVRFQVEGDGTRVAQRLSYRLRDRNPIALLASVLFVRSQLRAAISRSLLAFRELVERST